MSCESYRNRATNRRQVLQSAALAAALTTCPLLVGAAQGQAKDKRAIRAALGQMLMFGFVGKTVRDKPAQRLAQWLKQGKAGAVCYVKSNVGTKQELAELNALFASSATRPPLIAIDHEGGAVQRLREAHGFERLPKPIEIAARYQPEQSKALYTQTAKAMASLGFNLNLAPVVDLHNPDNPVIGKVGRAYGTDPSMVAAFAGAFIDAFAAAGVHCSVKHFPGHGNSTVDSHKGLPDIKASWSQAEAQPFAQLIAAGKARMIMTGHLLLEDQPATLSAATTSGMLRQKLGFQGVILTDDLDMEAVRGLLPRRERVIRSLAAGSDMLMIQNIIDPDPNLADSIADWVMAAIEDGRIDANAVLASAERIRSLSLPTVAG